LQLSHNLQSGSDANRAPDEPHNDEPESITQNLWLSRGIAPGLTDLGT